MSMSVTALGDTESLVQSDIKFGDEDGDVCPEGSEQMSGLLVIPPGDDDLVLEDTGKKEWKRPLPR